MTRLAAIFIFLFCLMFTAICAGQGSAQDKVLKRPLKIALKTQQKSTQAKQIIISFVGDVNPQILRGVSAKTLEGIRAHFKGSHIVYCNLESPITNCDVITSGKRIADVRARKDFVFKSDPEAINCLKKVGFTVVGLANNHIMDYTEKGLMDTIKALKKVGIAFCGAGENRNQAQAPAIIETNGTKVAFIQYSEIAPILSEAGDSSPGIAVIDYPAGEKDLKNILSSTKRARQEGAEIIIVALHWGKEGSSSTEKYQRVFAKKLISGGVDAVIGHHPHKMRIVEQIDGKTLAYSLGNFIFCSSYDRETFILKIHFTKNSDGKWEQRFEKKTLYLRGGIPGNK